MVTREWAADVNFAQLMTINRIKITGFCSVLIFIFLLASCKNKKDKQFAWPGNIFLDYKIIANEGDDNLTILLHFRDKRDGDALEIPAEGSVQFDGELIQPDSAKMTGFFYELHKPIDRFAGKHEIVYTDINKVVYKEEFQFNPLLLVSPLPDTLGRQPLELKFSGADSTETIQVVYRDTSFNNEDSRILGKRGQLSFILDSTSFEGLNPGPVQFDFIKEQKRKLNSATGAGGQLISIYTIRREVYLKE